MPDALTREVPLPGMPEPGPAPTLWAVRHRNGDTIPMPDEESARITAAVCDDLDRARWAARQEAAHQAEAIVWPGSVGEHAAAMKMLEREA